MRRSSCPACGTKDQVTLLAFNESVFTLARRSTDQAARERAIDLMDPWGGTALYDVIIRSIEILGRQPGRRSIVLFSDGDDQSSHAPLDLAIRKAEGSDATIYAVGQGRAVRSADLQKLMKQLARVSGGRAFFTEDPDRLYRHLRGDSRGSSQPVRAELCGADQSARRPMARYRCQDCERQVFGARTPGIPVIPSMIPGLSSCLTSSSPPVR